MRVFALLLAAQATPALACAVPTPPPPELAAWTVRPKLFAGGAALPLGQSALVTLVNRKDVGWVVAPGKAPARATNGGIFGFDIKRAGRYQIALSDAAWIDVVRDGKSLESTAHEHGGLCTGIRKVVGFDLTPGRYTLQLSGSAATMSKLLIAPALPQR